MLKEKLAAKIESSKNKVSPAAQAIMTTAKRVVADSIPTREIPDVGDRLPVFELVDSTGTKHNSANLVAERQLILTFFRGHW